MSASAKESENKVYKKTSSSWKKAYRVGYNSGANDYEEIATKFGCRLLAIIGYKNGLKSAHRTAKHLKQLEKEQGKQ